MKMTQVFAHIINLRVKQQRLIQLFEQRKKTNK